MANFEKLYRKDVFVFKHKYSNQYIQEVFRAFKDTKNKIKLLDIIRNVHESKMFSFLLLSYLIRRKPQLVPIATNLVLKNLGDIATFTAFYLSHFKRLPPEWFLNTLKHRVANMHGAQIDLFKYFSVPDRRIVQYLKKAGITFKQPKYSLIVYNKVPWYAYTGQYKPLLRELFSKVKANERLSSTEITSASAVLRNKEVLKNNDVTPLTLLLHYSAFKKAGAENPRIEPITRKITRAIEDAIDFKMQPLKSFNTKYDWVVIVNTECSRRRLDFHIKFKFYVDEIMAATAVIASLNNAEIAVVSNDFHRVPLEKSYAKTFTSIISTMLNTRTSNFKYNRRIPIKGTALILAPSVEDARKVEKSGIINSHTITYVPSEKFIDLWPKMMAGFSERSANYLAIPV
ncbi:hypothetical protein [Thermococcus barophilus]|nr:hypothetical protein [Thermococcus barophilus]